MKAINNIVIFEMSDTDWWAGENVESVKKAYLEYVGLDAEDAFGEGDLMEEPYELTDEQADTLQFRYDLHDDKKTRTFREQLQLMVDSGVAFPIFFASTEY